MVELFGYLQPAQFLSIKASYLPKVKMASQEIMELSVPVVAQVAAFK